MDNYKKLLGKEMNQQAEWKPMNDFIIKLEGLMQFYSDFGILRTQINKC